MLAAGGVHVCAGSAPSDVAAVAVLACAVDAVLQTVVDNTFPAKREAAFSTVPLDAMLRLGRGVLLDATLRNRLGRAVAENASSAALGSWRADAVAEVLPNALEVAWPGAALLVDSLPSRATVWMQMGYGYQHDELPHASREATLIKLQGAMPTTLAWLRWRTLVAAARGGAHAAWCRRRCAVMPVAAAV